MGGNTQSRPLARRARAYVQFTIYGQTGQEKIFSKDRLQQMISGKSIFRVTTNDLCKYQILGDPKEAGNYVKFNIF
jgi:hypothetical protein